MRILVIPTTDWLKHPVPNRLNFICDRIAEHNDVHVLGFDYDRFNTVTPRETRCNIISSGKCTGSLSQFYLRESGNHYATIKNAIKEHDIQVILSANILPSFMATHVNIPIVYDYLDVMHEAASGYISNPITKKFTEMTVYDLVKHNLKHATKIITITNGLKEYVISNILHDFKRWEDISVISNGVDTETFVPLSPQEKLAYKKEYFDTTKPVIGYVGSVESWVDLITPMKAMRDIDGVLAIVGPTLFSSASYKAKAFAATCGYSEKIKFIDAVPYRTLPRIVGAFDIGINPLVDSVHNKHSAGGKIFNYLSCGVPMLTTPAVSPPYWPDYEAYHFYNNTEEFSYVASKMLINSVNSQKLHEVAKDYDWKKLAVKYEDVLKSVV